MQRFASTLALASAARHLLGATASSTPALRGPRRNASASESAMPRQLSDSQVFCTDSGEWDNINWCGGADADWSCTPWNFRVDWTKSCDEGKGCFTTIQCDAGDGELLVGDDSTAGTYIAKWQDDKGTWHDSRSSADPNYFVFHTCDGTGLQSDCKGSTWYVEQLSQWNQGNSGDPWPGQVHPQGTNQISFNFQHPGTGNNYEWYWCGWWSKVSAGWAGWDAGANWIEATGVDKNDPTPWFARDKFGGADADATMALYPWICTVDPDMTKTGIQPGAAMYAGDHPNGNWNCFCDNNGPQGSPKDWQPPPHFKFYSMKKEADGGIRVIGVAGDAAGEDFKIWGFDEAW